jgi:hypothetical protein
MHKKDGARKRNRGVGLFIPEKELDVALLCPMFVAAGPSDVGHLSLLLLPVVDR